MRRLSRRGAGRCSSRGLTLIELMVGLAVLAVLIAAGAPFMGDMVVNSRLRESGNLLYGESMMAQSEAIKRNTVVRVTAPTSDTLQVHDMTNAAAPVLLRERTLPAGATLPTSTSFSFGPEGRPEPFGTAVSVNVGLSGGTCSDDLRCPGLRIDAGGAVRLCSNQLASCP
ncbi:MAG: hypothetical protein AMXMBFR78_01640 [Rubrivivax sp.]